MISLLLNFACFAVNVNLRPYGMVAETLVSNLILSPGSPVLGGISGILSAAASVAVMQPIDTSRAYLYLKPDLYKDVTQAFRQGRGLH